MKALLICVALLALASVVAVFFGRCECYFAPYPQIATRYATGYVESTFSSLSPGMSASSVEARIGAPLWKAPKHDGTEEWGYTRDKDLMMFDFAWLVRSVVISNGVVIGTFKKVAYD
jgi:hypothetical protein